MAESAIVVRLNDRRKRLDQAQADMLRALLLPFEDQLGDTISELLYHIDRRTHASSGWTFVMLSPSQNEAVVNYLVDHSSRPKPALKLWALCFCHLNNDTGEIMLSREEIAARISISAETVSRIMGELQRRNAIITRRVPMRGMRGKGPVRYFMNPCVATHLTGKVRELAQDTTGPAHASTSRASTPRGAARPAQHALAFAAADA